MPYSNRSSGTVIREKLVVSQPGTIALEYLMGGRAPSPRGGPDQFFCELTGGRIWYAALKAYLRVGRFSAMGAGGSRL